VTHLVELDQRGSGPRLFREMPGAGGAIDGHPSYKGTLGLVVQPLRKQSLKFNGPLTAAP